MPDSQHDVTDSAQPDGANKRDSLMDLAEPDDAFLLASEQEDSLAAPRRGLIVIVTDHPGEQSDSTSQLVSELLAEANFRVDGAIVVHVPRPIGRFGLYRRGQPCLVARCRPRWHGYLGASGAPPH